jgi:hypothetical protein
MISLGKSEPNPLKESGSLGWVDRLPEETQLPQ